MQSRLRTIQRSGRQEAKPCVPMGVWLCLLVMWSVPGCTSTQPATIGPATATDATSDAAPARASLEDRAAELWTARQAEDWATVYRFQDLREIPDATEANFAAWASKEEPFVVHSFEIGQVVTDDNYGWVEMASSVSMRQYVGVPARDTQRWEKWHVRDDAWYPVGPKKLDSAPAPPPLRDLEAEQRLLARFQAACVAREAGDWARLAEYSDPSQHGALEAAEAAGMESQIEYLSHDVQWVEVIGDRGTVRVNLEFRLRDPNMRKLPVRNEVINDRWVRRDSEWYLDPRGPQS